MYICALVSEPDRFSLMLTCMHSKNKRGLVYETIRAHGFKCSKQQLNYCFTIVLTLFFTAAIFGEDVGFGGVFRCSANLRDKYGQLLLELQFDSLYSYCIVL